MSPQPPQPPYNQQSHSMYNNYPQDHSYYENPYINPVKSNTNNDWNFYKNQNPNDNVFYPRTHDFRNRRDEGPYKQAPEMEEQEMYTMNQPNEFQHVNSMDQGPGLQGEDWRESSRANQFEYSNYKPQYQNRPMLNSQMGRNNHQSEMNLHNRNQHQYHQDQDQDRDYMGNQVNPFNNYEDDRIRSAQKLDHQNREFDNFQRYPNNGIHVGSTGMPINQMMKNQGSKKSLNVNMMRNNFLGSGDAQSVRSLQQNIFLNRYEDDCLYMNLEEEYLHKVSKRLGKGTGVSINKSMYNFK